MNACKRAHRTCPSQRDGLLDCGHGKALHPNALEMSAHRDGAVAVRIGLDHCGVWWVGVEEQQQQQKTVVLTLLFHGLPVNVSCHDGARKRQS